MTNVLRTQMVAAAVQRAHDGKLQINVKNVSLFLPGPGAFTAELKAQPDFELDLDDLSPYLPPDEQPPLPPEVMERLKDAVIELPEPVLETPSPVDPRVRYQQLELRSLELERERVDLRFRHDTAIRDELAARHALEAAARAFMAGFGKPMSRDELLKQHAASEAERRRQIAAGELPSPRPRAIGPSALDRYAYNTGGARGRRVGPGGEQVFDFRRGGQRPNAELSRQAKLPSER
jgi:hypothetical protein